MNTTSPDATAQKTAADAATPSEAPTATSPATVARDATTSLAEPVSETSRRIARAILSTLTPYAASSVLSALAGLAHAIIAAASTLRHASGEPARHAASTTLDAAACDAIDSLDGTASSAAYAVCAAWWFATPCDVVASFWRSDDARANTEAQALGALAEVDVMRREVSQNDPSAAVRYVEGLPFPAVRLADGSTLVNPAAVRPLARGGEELPEGVARLDAGGFSWRRTSERVTDAPVENIREHLTRHGLETALRSDAPVAARVLRVEAPPFASASKGVAASIGRALYFAEPSVEGFADAASGLAGLTSELACSTDTAGLVAGLAQIAAHHAARAVEARTAQDAGAYLGFASEALDAARGAARLTLDALDAAPPSTGTGDVKVRAA